MPYFKQNIEIYVKSFSFNLVFLKIKCSCFSLFFAKTFSINTNPDINENNYSNTSTDYWKVKAIPSKQSFYNASIVKSKSNFSVHFPKCFVTVSNAPITTGITSTFLIFQIFAISYYYRYNFYLSHFPNFCNFILQLTIICSFFFFLLFNASDKWD